MEVKLDPGQQKTISEGFGSLDRCISEEEERQQQSLMPPTGLHLPPVQQQSSLVLR